MQPRACAQDLNLGELLVGCAFAFLRQLRRNRESAAIRQINDEPG
jgi:hypothetical protein